MDYEDLVDFNDMYLLRVLERRPPKPRTRNNPFEIYDEAQSITKYRFTKQFAKRIVNLVKTDIEKDSRGRSICPEIQVTAALRNWARPEVQDDTADLHGISQQAVSDICDRVAIALASKSSQFIHMPSGIEAQIETARQFERIAGFKNVIGAIDGTHIKLKKVGGNEAQFYINRKGFYSLNVQVVSDANLKINDIVARWRGSTHNSRIFSESLIKQKMERGDFHGCLLGDSGYALTPYLFTPVLNPRNVKEEAYNYAHIRTWNVVERCFGVWKQRFLCLQKGLNLKF